MSFTPDGEWIDDGATFIHVHEWCPVCAPEGVPDPWTLRPCNLHIQGISGSADVCIRSDTFLSGSAEAGGEENQAFCRLIHQKSQ